MIFNTSDYYRIRVLEVIFMGLPFLIFLLLKGEYWCAGGVFLASIIASFHRGVSLFIKTIPTPFGKYPFEFVIGFRQYILLIAFTYFTLLMGVKVGNYELALFSIAAQAFITVFFHNWVEPKDYVTIHSMTSLEFLKNKLEIALRQMGLLFIIPLFLVLTCFPSQWWISLILVCICYLYLATVITSKYAFYPSEFNLLQAILLGVSLFFPPLLVILLPYYLAKARKNLNSYLSS
jgi:hypothetical protein